MTTPEGKTEIGTEDSALAENRMLPLGELSKVMQWAAAPPFATIDEDEARLRLEWLAWVKPKLGIVAMRILMERGASMNPKVLVQRWDAKGGTFRPESMLVSDPDSDFYWLAVNVLFSAAKSVFRNDADAAGVRAITERHVEVNVLRLTAEKRLAVGESEFEAVSGVVMASPQAAVLGFLAWKGSGARSQDSGTRNGETRAVLSK